MIEDLFVPDPPSGDSSNRIADTRFVQNTVGSATVNGPSIAGLSVLGNASTVAATTAAITGAANQLLAVNAAATSVLFESISTYLDGAIASTQGAILYRNNSTWVALAPGTQSTFLQTQGAGANPQWAAAALVLLNTLTPNNVASATDSTSITASYQDYLVTFDNILPITNTVTLGVQVATNRTTFQTTSYLGEFCSGVNGVSSSSNSSTGKLDLSTSISTASGYGYGGQVYLRNPASGTARAFFTGNAIYQNGAGQGGLVVTTFGGYWDSNTAVNALAFVFSAGNIATGTIKVYGIA